MNKKFVIGLVITAIFLVSCGTPTTTSNETGTPTVSITSTSSSITTDDECTITADASDPDGDTLSYLWYVDDTVQPGETERTFTFSSTSDGSYTVKVEVSDGSNTVSDNLEINVTKPEVNFTKTSDITSFTGITLSSNKLRCVYASGQNIYGGTSEGLIYSEDGGAN